MNQQQAIPNQQPNMMFVRSIGLDLVLTIITCGIYNLYVQYKQMEAVNYMLRENKYSWLLWLILTIITCGLYHIYHEYRKCFDIEKCLNQRSHEPVISVVLTIFGLPFVADAVQQSMINRYYGSNAL